MEKKLKSNATSDKFRWQSIIDGIYLPFNPLIFWIFPIYGATRWTEILKWNEIYER